MSRRQRIPEFHPDGRWTRASPGVQSTMDGEPSDNNCAGKVEVGADTANLLYRNAQMLPLR